VAQLILKKKQNRARDVECLFSSPGTTSARYFSPFKNRRRLGGEDVRQVDAPKRARAKAQRVYFLQEYGGLEDETAVLVIKGEACRAPLDDPLPRT
jgi:hypothetical protein